MFGAPMLDIAIGLIFVYLLLSLICSAIYEIGEAWFKMRAGDLERGIRELLNGPPGANSAQEDLAEKLYKHPLVSGLFRGEFERPVDGKFLAKLWSGGSKLPSYIPARQFALALMDVVLPANGAAKSGAAGATVPSPADAAPMPLTSLRDALEPSPGTHAKKALLTLVDAAGNDMNRARENIESWYNGAMDRVSGLYKRRAQTWILIMGFAVAVALNVDTIGLMTGLARDKETRTALVAAAQKYAEQQPGATSRPAKERLNDTVAAVDALGLPIGWDDRNTLPGPEANRPWYYWPLTLSLKLIGWSITAFAVSLGAPFWFDLLNRFMVIRSTVKPHEKSREEKSND